MKTYEVTGIKDQFRIVTLVIRARDPQEARQKMRAKFKRGALTGYPITVRETVPEPRSIAREGDK